jgi:hypothetical protein
MSGANYCAQCGSKLEVDSHFCAKCGASRDTETRVIKKSPKSALVALLLCLFLGTFGIHRFYVGKIGTGILMLLTAGGFGIWFLIDLIRIACSDFTDSQGNYLELMKSTAPTYQKVLLVIGVLMASFIMFVLSIIAIAFYATSGITDTVRDQLAALRAGDYVKAYSYTSKDFQSTTSFDEFKKFIDQHPALKNNKDSTFTRREIENNMGAVSGTLEAVDGATTPIEYHLIRENGQWKILYLKLNPSGAAVKPDEMKQTSTHTSAKHFARYYLPLSTLYIKCQL